ncbi:MAG: hypothetical protein HZB17_05295 [Chloroflexi bacterium]|nr:hypothetical protein [Chloroflexota bacterium]
MSSGNITFLDLAESVLQNSKDPLTPEEIWNRAEQNSITKQLKKYGRATMPTPDLKKSA